jgi:L-lactate dehydrogenase complex protein LldE
MIREHFPKMAAASPDASVGRDVDALLPRVYEFCELLVDKFRTVDTGASFPHTVTLHTTCHSLRGTKIGERPVQLLRAVRGLSYVELPQADQCCGFGGTFAIKNADVSAAMLSDKVRAILDTQAEICTAVDNSCLMHIGGALSRQRAGVRCLHLAEILASTPGEFA